MSRTRHRLSALCFLDIVGYGPLAATDERAALLLIQTLKASVRRAADLYEGRVVQFLDGVALLEFSNTEDAVLAGHAVLGEFGAAAAEAEVEAALRGSVHAGEVALLDGENLYGEMVHVAAQLRRHAEAGQILASDEVRRQLAPRPDFRFTPLGTRDVDGAGPIPVHAVEVPPSFSGAASRAEGAGGGSAAAGGGPGPAGSEVRGSSRVAKIRDFVEELRQRRVFRVAVLYAVISWIVIEVVATTFPVLMLPEWTTRVVVVVAVAGFPLALVLAWAFEQTPQGVRRAPPAAGWRRRLFYIGLLVVSTSGVGYLLLGVPYPPGSGGDGSPASGDVAPAARTGTEPPSALLPEGLTSEAERERSVAVLPFLNLSPDEDDAYFGEAITDEIITALARVGDLRVISRTSVMQYRDTEKTAPEIGRELGVRAILQGSVLKSGEQVRITAQLIDTRTDDHLWVDQWHRDIEDVFQIQADIAGHIAASLQAGLTEEERRRIARQPTANAVAYDYYLKAREHFFRGTKADNERAARLFREAVSRDSTFAAAWAGLSEAMVGRLIFGGRPEWLDSAVVIARLRGDA